LVLAAAGRFRVQVGLAAASVALLLLTLVWRDWIEIVFRVDPDQGSGSLEWILVGVFAAAALLLSAVAGRHVLKRRGSRRVVLRA
jgi:hypothetical protein